jgi:hypothetical protein
MNLDTRHAKNPKRCYLRCQKSKFAETGCLVVNRVEDKITKKKTIFDSNIPKKGSRAIEFNYDN